MPALATLPVLLALVSPARGVPDTLPPVGIAARDTAGGWCASMTGGPLAVGSPATLVFADPDAPAVSQAVRVVRRRPGPCHAEFPQLSLEELPAYDLAAVGPVPGRTPWVALVVAGDAAWRRDPDGAARADLDGDGLAEEARVCAADEGQHFALWTIEPGGGRRRRWHGYYDWGALVDVTCGPGESGR